MNFDIKDVKRITQIKWPVEYQESLKEDLKLSGDEKNEDVWNSIINANSFNLACICTDIVEENKGSFDEELFDSLYKEGMILLTARLNQLKEKLPIEKISSAVLLDGIKQALISLI